VSSIDRQQAAAALSAIETIAQRVRQSRLYRLASWMLVLWGALTCAAYVANWLWPRQAMLAWIAVDILGIAGSFAISAAGRSRNGVSTFNLRALLALLLFLGFGLLWSSGLAHFPPRQLGVFWATYFMMAYVIAGLWLGPAFVAIGLSVTALALLGYAIAGDWFELWMAVVNGGGLILGGLWMRRN